MKDWAKQFYASRAWHELRAAYWAQHPLCERCKRRGRYNATAIIHHKVYLTPRNIDDASVSLNPDNLEALCIDCHNREHSRRAPRVRAAQYTLRADGTLSPPADHE